MVGYYTDACLGIQCESPTGAPTGSPNGRTRITVPLDETDIVCYAKKAQLQVIAFVELLPEFDL